VIVFILSLTLLIFVSIEQGYFDNMLNNSEEINEDELELFDTSDAVHPLGEDCLDGHDGMAMHFHPYLTIIVDDEEIPIPSNTGIDTTICPSAMHVTHTHDDSGKLHVEHTEVVDVPLEVFFDVWGVHFDETGIFDYRDGDIEMKVDGEISNDYQNHLLEDAQQIIITYTSHE
jgi:hypothetical protein